MYIESIVTSNSMNCCFAVEEDIPANAPYPALNLIHKSFFRTYMSFICFDDSKNTGASSGTLYASCDYPVFVSNKINLPIGKTLS